MSEQTSDLGATTLASGFTAGGTSMTVAANASFPQSGTFYFRVQAESSNTTELFHCTAGAGTNSWTVVGAQGTPVATSASNHSSGAIVTQVLTTAGLLAVIDQQVALTVNGVQTSAYTASAHELVLYDPSGGGFAITLPTIPSGAAAGAVVSVKNVTASTNDTQLWCASGNSIDVTSYVIQLLNAGESFTLVSDGVSNWNVIGSYNTLVGLSDVDTAVGVGALASRGGPAGQCAFGYQALGNSTGSGNACVGYTSGTSVTSGTFNSMLGCYSNCGAGDSYNNCFGYQATVNSGNSYGIAIGAGATCTTSSSTAPGLYFPAALNTVATSGSTAVYYNTTTGQMGPTASTRRKKKNIRKLPFDPAALLKLRAVSFEWKKPTDGNDGREFGLIAEEVQAHIPMAVPLDKEGLPYGVHYDRLIVPAIEVIKRQEKRIAKLESAVKKMQAKEKR